MIFARRNSKDLFLSCLNFLYLTVQSTNISVRLLWSLFNLHDGNKRVCVIHQHPYDCMHL